MTIPNDTVRSNQITEQVIEHSKPCKINVTTLIHGKNGDSAQAMIYQHNMGASLKLNKDSFRFLGERDTALLSPNMIHLAPMEIRIISRDRFNYDTQTVR